MQQRSALRWTGPATLAVVLAACGDESEDAESLANRAPEISGTPATAIPVGQTYSFSPSASDPDGDDVIFGIDGKPEWMAFDTVTGHLSGTPKETHIGAHRGIVVWASDGEQQSLLPAFDVSVLSGPQGPNNAPEISGQPLRNIAAGSDYSFTPTASDPDEDRIVFSVHNLPAWAAFNSSVGRIQGTPALDDVGRYENVVISVTDGQLTSVLAPFAIVVTDPNVNTPPTIAGVPAAFVLQGTLYAFQPFAEDAEGDTLTFSVANAPPWTSFNVTSGHLTGTPSAGDVGTFADVVISVSDGTTEVSLPPFSITVTESNAPPTIAGTPAAAVLVDQEYLFQPTAFDADGDVLTFNIVNPPAWASFDTGTGRLQGTPGAGDVGTDAQISISVSDGEATATLASFSITVVAVNRPPTISGVPAGTVTVGEAYSFMPTAADLDGDSLTFNILNRPSWASFDSSTGLLQGTPGPGDVGPHNSITISVSDGEFTSSLPSFAIVVSTSNVAPTISGAPATTAMQDVAYAFQPTAGDADGDALSFSVTNLPAWASFNTSTGLLDGTPGAEHIGIYAGIVIGVSDGMETVSLPAFSITVNALALGSATLSWTAPTENTDGSPLDDLAGFKIYWGTQPGNYGPPVVLDNPGLTTYVVEGLAPGTYYFSATAFNSSGVESAFSNAASKTISP